MTSRDNAVVEEAMAMMGISPLAGRKVSSLSDGERQKCMIAKALAQETPLMFFDEPTSFLDFQSKVALFKLFRSLAAETGKAVLVSTHDVELAVRLADRLWIISSGIMHEGTVGELSQNGVMAAFVNDGNLRYDSRSGKIEIL
jgi:iron complex transport system ATP-binding protein